MTNNEIMMKMYDEDFIRDVQFMKYHLHHDVELEWHSSQGHVKWGKAEMLKFSDEVATNFSTSKFDIKYFFEQGNTISLHYHYFASTFENPNELFLVGRFATVWEFKDNKMFKCYQISQVD